MAPPSNTAHAAPSAKPAKTRAQLAPMWRSTRIAPICHKDSAISLGAGTRFDAIHPARTATSTIAMTTNGSAMPARCQRRIGEIRVLEGREALNVLEVPEALEVPEVPEVSEVPDASGKRGRRACGASTPRQRDGDVVVAARRATARSLTSLISLIVYCVASARRALCVSTSASIT